MSEEKMMMHSCCHHCKKHWLFNLGILALIYGVAKWIVVTYALMPDAVWILAGLLLLLVVWIKKSMYKGDVCPECSGKEHEEHESH